MVQYTKINGKSFVYSITLRYERQELMKVISDIKVEAKKIPVKDLIICIGEDIKTAVPAKENPRYSQKFWDEVQEALKEAEDYEIKKYGKVLPGMSVEEWQNMIKSRRSLKKVSSRD